MAGLRIEDYVDVDSIDGTELMLVSKSGVYRKTTIEEIRNLAKDIANTELADLFGKIASAQDVKNILNNISNNFENVNMQLSDKVNQSDLDTTNANVAANTNTIATKANSVDLNVQKIRIDTLVQTASTSYYEKCTSTDTGALLIVASGATTGQINLANVTPVATGYTATAGDYVRLVYGVAGGSSELIDSRIDGIGIGHLTIGDSVRSIFSVLKNRYIDLISLNTYEQGRFDAATGLEVDSTTQCRTAKQMQIPINTSFTFKTKNSSNYAVLVWEYDSTGAFVKYTQYTATPSGITFTVGNSLVNFAFVYGGSFTNASQVSSVFSITLRYTDYTDTVLVDANSYSDTNLETAKSYRDEKAAEREIDRVGILDITWTQGGLTTLTGAERESSTLIRTGFISTDGVAKLLNIKRKTGSSTITTQIFYFDANKSYLSEDTSINYDYTKLITAPYFRIQMTIGTTVPTDGTNISFEFLKKTKFNGGKMSILGDSISTFSGISPSDGATAAYFPAGNIDIYQKTWWGQLLDMLGMTLDKNNSYSSSTFTSPNTNTYMADDTRLSALGNPNLIFVEGGPNDIYIGKGAGTWNGYDIGTLDTTDFTQAVTKVISYLQANYPDAEIVFITPNFIDNKGTYSGRTYCTIENINTICSAIINVCNYMGVHYIDTRKVGLTMFNFDSMTVDHLHWDYNFTKILSRYIYNQILNW